MHKQKTCDTCKIQVMQRAYPSETANHILIIKTQLTNALLNDYFKRDNPTCLPYSRTQISALFFSPSHNYEKNILTFVLKQNVCLIKMCASKLQDSNIELLRSIKMNSTQTVFQKNKIHNKIATAMTVQSQKQNFSVLVASQLESGPHVS